MKRVELRRCKVRSRSESSDSSDNSSSAKEEEEEEMPQKVAKQSKSQDKDKRSKNSSTTQKGEPPPEPLVKTGRKTNNSLASATGQIVIPDNDEPVNSTRKKLKTSQIFGQTDEDVQTDMYKVLKQLTAHDDAWPFIDPVEEEYAPNYYAVIRRPMDLRKMEERLDSGYYTDFSMFKADFKLIVNNCRLYNGQDNEYTVMVDNLQTAFDRLTERYLHRLSSSDEEIAVEYQLPTPSRKHKLKSSESPSHHKRKKRKSHLDAGDPKSSSSDAVQEEKQEEKEEEEEEEEEDIPAREEPETKKTKESHKNKQSKGKKKRKGHHRHGKHSKNHKKDSHRYDHGESSKTRHSKKQKHSKNKDKEGKKSKQKKKKTKHHDPEPVEVLKRSASQESLESSNRSRSASPLPSIHTPTPSPTELDRTESPEVNDTDFVKDKYDKIKERRRHANKEAWESLFDYKQKTGDKQKQNLSIPDKDKNQKLRETIEKLKAKNEKYKDSSLFNTLFAGSSSNADKMSESSNTNDLTIREDSEDEPSDKSQTSVKPAPKKGKKKTSAKNESASEALEQAVKDISKWLDDAPKGSTMSSPCDSPAQTISTEEHDNSRLDDELSQGEKPHGRKDLSRKRPSSREPKLVKRREIQRTIDRLQPGKSKGNLLTNMSNKNAEKTEEVTPQGPQNKVRDSQKVEESSPKLSLGSVLPTVEFSLGNDHNFANNDEGKKEDKKEIVEKPEIEKKEEKVESVPTVDKTAEVAVQANKKDAEVETELQIPTKPSQEKATPNLSAWFKAFGAPKTTTTTTTVPTTKKKVEEVVAEVVAEKPPETNTTEAKPSSPKNPVKYDSPTGPDTPNPDGGDSPLPNVGTTPRQRRTSTGSSVSERSSFSQDLDSPRHQMSHNSPLLRSPASPRTEDFQKITYPIINGTVRAGFYQDTTSMKSSPEKSCSPREAPQSPYSPYSQHVYALNSITGSSTPNYFVDHTKSPLPTYNQNPPSYYDSSKNPIANKSTRNHDDYTCLAPDTYQQNQYTGPYSPVYSPYSQTTTPNYSQVQHSPQTPTSNNATSSNASPLTAESKTQLFPVKKRTYNETDHSTLSTLKVSDSKENAGTICNKNEYPKLTSALHSIQPTSVDDIALALSEKSELAKLNSLREKNAVEYAENRDNVKYDNNNSIHDAKKSISIDNKSNDLINMGYLNADNDRRSSSDNHTHEVEYLSRDMTKSTTNSHHKGYDVDAIAINLGLNSQALQKTIAKSINSSNIPPAHSQDRSHSELNLNQNLVHAHHSQYDAISGGQGISNFSISDIDMANKKLYACNAGPSSTALDYGSWKITNQLRKQDLMPSDYSTAYSANSAEKLKNEINAANSTAVSYSKNLQHQQYNAYNTRPSLQRAQDLQQNLPGELRIPNPRGLLKSDHMVSSSSMSDADVISKSMDTHSKLQKTDKLVQNHPLVSSNPYKTPYSSTPALDSLRNLSNIPQMLERYTSDERYLSSFANNSSLYHDKFQMSQMFNKSISSDVHPVSTSVSIYSQPAVSMSKDNGIYKTSSVQTQHVDTKTKNKRKRTLDTKQPTQIIGNQAYHQSSCNTDVLSSVKSSMMPGTAFNFGTSNMALSSGLYGDNGSFSIEDFRNNPQHQLMAANYMVAAVAHQQRTNAEVNAEKLVKPAHQNSAHTASSFPFLGHTQVRAGYPFVGTDATSPLYQQYLQRHQEELLRQTGAQIMSLYPTPYPATLGTRPPYDLNRPAWL